MASLANGVLWNGTQRLFSFDRALERSRHATSGYPNCDWVRRLLENEMTTRPNPYTAVNRDESSRLQSARLVSAVVELGSLGLLFT